MVDFKPFTSSSERALPLYNHNTLRQRAVPNNVPQDIDMDYVMEHLNDPNIDLKPLPPLPRPETLELDLKTKKGFGYADTDAESQSSGRTSEPSRSTPSRTSAVEFDE
jgi:hypothetical protein